MNINGTYHQPTFLYESVWNVLGFIVLVLLRKSHTFKRRRSLFRLYNMVFFRPFLHRRLTDGRLYAFSNIRVSQLLSLVMFVAAIVIVIVRRRNPNLKFYNREKQKKNNNFLIQLD